MFGPILVGVDGSETAFKAARRAAQLAVITEAELHVVCVYDVDMVDSLKAFGGHVSHSDKADAYRTLVSGEERAAEQSVASVGERLRKEFPELSVITMAVPGSPAGSLVRQSKRLDAELIVVGNKRVQGPGRVLGSVARAVASEAECDVYVANTHK